MRLIVVGVSSRFYFRCMTSSFFLSIQIAPTYFETNARSNNMFHRDEDESDAIDALVSLSSSNPMMSFAESSTFKNTKKHQLPVRLRYKNSGYETLLESNSGKSPKVSHFFKFDIQKFLIFFFSFFSNQLQMKKKPN